MSMDDPFGGLENNVETPKDTMSTTKTATATANASDAVSYFLNQMTVREEDYEEPQRYVPYIKPAERTWVPLVITKATVETREARLVVAYDSSGECVTDPKKIEKIVEAGGEEVVETGVSYYQFRLEADHLGAHFGDRPSPYLLFVPVFAQKIAFKEARKNRRTGEYELGFVKDVGRKLLAATRVGLGVAIPEDEEFLNNLAEELVGKRIMAQVNRREVKRSGDKPRVNSDGSFVKAKIDQDTQTVIRLTKTEGGSYVNTATGEAYEGNTAGLIPFTNEQFLIPDNSDFGQVVRDPFESVDTYDNLYDETFRVPNVVMVAKQVTKEIAERFEVADRLDGKKEVSRYAEIVRTNGDEVKGQITWETVGFVATATKAPGTAIQATLAEIDPTTNKPRVITATWLGTHWEETPQPHHLVVSEDDGKPRLVPVAPAAPSGLDTFKGDASN